MGCGGGSPGDYPTGKHEEALTPGSAKRGRADGGVSLREEGGGESDWEMPSIRTGPQLVEG